MQPYLEITLIFYVPNYKNNFKSVYVKSLINSVEQIKIFINKIGKVFLLKGVLNHIVIV